MTSIISKQNFQNPPIPYRPWTRWWLPGGDIQLDELLREIRLFADTMFGGAEIQPFVAGMNRATLNDHSSAVYDYDSPEYYEKIVAVLEEAKTLGLQIDLTLGSGWPAGGKFVPLEDNVDTLVYGETTITRAVDMPVPAPIMPFAYAIFAPDSKLPVLMGREWVRTLTYHPETARLIAVVAAKITDNGRSPDPSILTDTMSLDIDTVIDITAHVDNGHIRWQPPTDGEWQIVSIYTMASGSHLLIAAVAEENYVTDPFDSEAILRFYEGWIGKHPELLAYAGSTLRALFSDSYEYFAQRLFSEDFIELFRQNRGYDPTPFLPAVFQPARDQHFFFFTGMRTATDFSFGEVSQRIIHDYDLTVSELFFKHWYPVSREWIERHNLQFRQQGYNPPLDVMRAAGAATIPETEGGNPLWLKRVASGGHLYGRPLISAESFVFLPKGGFALTPQDYKQEVDLLLTAGVNHIIYHGTPYRWEAEGYGETGWSPFISPYTGTNISTTISEADPFWKYQSEFNQYVARLQVLLQQGAPDADVLIYLPLFDNPDHERFLPVVKAIDASGYAWEWVNDDLIAQANWTDAGLEIGEMVFQAIVLPDIRALPVATATRLAQLSQEGLPIAVFGQQPSQQPGYLNYVENDKLVAEAIRAVLAPATSAHITDTDTLTQFIGKLPRGGISYESNPALCYIRRDLGDGTLLAFIRNTTSEPTHFTLLTGTDLTHIYWLDARNGNIHQQEQSEHIRGWLPAYGSIAVMAGTHALFLAGDLSPENPVQEPDILDAISLEDWRLAITGDDVPDGHIKITSGALGDWSKDEGLRYISSVGIYETSFHLSDIQADKRYELDLGEVFAAADVTVNGREARHAIFSPYRVDVTPYLKVGDNSLRVEVTPPLRNRLLGKALKGDPQYAQFVGRGPFANPNPVPAGLAGPVTLQIIKGNH